MLDTGSQLRIVQHVDNGAMNVRHGGLDPTGPDTPSPKHHSRPDVADSEGSTVVLLFPCSYRSLRHHDNITENLLC